MAEIYKPESSEMAKTWNPQEVEDKLYREWEENGYFTAHREEGKKPFTIVMPPPNITGQLHMGHALDAMLQDVPTRYHRMKGDPTLWLPGHRPRFDCDRGQDRRPAEGRGPDQSSRSAARNSSSAPGTGREKYGRPHSPSAAQAGRVLRLDPPALHDGRGLQQARLTRCSCACMKRA